VPPNSAFTRFLKQGLKRRLCPLCRVTYKGHEYEGEPAEREADSWERAIRLTVGWPKDQLHDPPPVPEDRYRPPEFARVRQDEGKCHWLAYMTTPTELRPCSRR
jgi:hypothetical protein